MPNAVWELCYISHLNRFTAFAGMIFAINQPIASLQLRKLESSRTTVNVLAKGSICLALAAATFIGRRVLYNCQPTKCPILTLDLFRC